MVHNHLALYHITIAKCFYKCYLLEQEICSWLYLCIYKLIHRQIMSCKYKQYFHFDDDLWSDWCIWWCKRSHNKIKPQPKSVDICICLMCLFIKFINANYLLQNGYWRWKHLVTLLWYQMKAFPQPYSILFTSENNCQ